MQLEEFELSSRKLPGWIWIAMGFCAAFAGFGTAVWLSEVMWPQRPQQQSLRAQAPFKQRSAIPKTSSKKTKVNSRIPESRLAGLLAEVGFPAHAIPKMVCTARYESAFDTAARNENRNGSVDIGLFQINELWLQTCGLTERQLLDPTNNAECAKKVFDERGYWAWYGYRKNQLICKSYEVQKGVAQKRDKMTLAMQ
jgi:hypothetical protein